jgi:hypothetical protein
MEKKKVNDLERLKEVVERHLNNSKHCLNVSKTRGNHMYDDVFQGEVDACSRILTVINEMIKEKEG